ncbi:hypothetical protein CONLIGDRAFT_687248 [Coniochaeta ligniaria NRRL 30616]|uniref:Carbohydrate-binding module family 18 protein n=1 Tax=Coniochaeta ligniaria NRRL 30616 TaxID=1408157 RepID=A0A1J7I5N4_9PEZI|nr:hypothetical protein CONLIGDRAFT_687248 [Coniochaeta ligniaria NRRL 30616]
MVQSRFPGFLLAVTVCLSPVFAATCTRVVTAKAGDTCAILSGANALTVTQFIQLNPGISTCSLLPGATYCVSDDPAAVPTTPRTTAVPVPTTSRPAGPIGTLVPSPDGSDGICGGEYTCLGSVYGDCCSANGYCGNTTEYCGEDCNSVFGRCGGGVPADEPGTGTAPTVTVTVIGGLPTCPAAATRTVTATITINHTVTTKPQTVTQTVTTTASAPARPSPTLEGTDAGCKTYYQWKVTDSCNRLSLTLGISLADLYSINPELDCDNPPRGYYICIGA